MAEEQVLFSLPLIRVEPIFKKWMREVLQEDGTGTKGSTSQEVPLTIHEAAMITGKSVSTLYGYVHRGLIPHMKRGQRLYFYRNELIQWIESGRVKTVDEIKQNASYSLDR
jgi:excisionase family DNA binding protein